MAVIFRVRGATVRGERRGRLCPLLVGLALLVVMRAGAEQGASVLVFPRVAAAEDRDTLVQLANLTESTAHVRCFYAGNGPPVVAFRLELGRLQPTMWSARQGRAVDSSDLRCGAGNLSCVGAGNDPGEIPALIDGFEGALWCVQTDAEGRPSGGDALSGQATIEERDSGDIARHGAIGLAAAGPNDGDEALCLGGEPRPDCPSGAEYEGCPDTWLLPHLADGTIEPATRDGTVGVEMSLALCSQDLAASGSEARLTFALTNELEESFSAATTVPGWSSFGLAAAGSVFRREVAGTDQVFTRIRSAGGAASGLIVAAEVVRDNGDGTARSALQPLRQGSQSGGDVLRLPPASESR